MAKKQGSEPPADSVALLVETMVERIKTDGIAKFHFNRREGDLGFVGHDDRLRGALIVEVARRLDSKVVGLDRLRLKQLLAKLVGLGLMTQPALLALASYLTRLVGTPPPDQVVQFWKIEDPVQRFSTPGSRRTRPVLEVPGAA